MQAATHNAAHLKVLEKLAPKSGMAVPLIVRGRVLGAMSYWHLLQVVAQTLTA